MKFRKKIIEKIQNRRDRHYSRKEIEKVYDDLGFSYHPLVHSLTKHFTRPIADLYLHNVCENIEVNGSENILPHRLQE